MAVTEDRKIEYDKKELLEALFEADIESVREAIDMELISCRELVEYYLERIDAYNDLFNCFITLCDDTALSEADKKDEMLRNGTADGKLFGIPIVLKDNIEYEGYYTTNGRTFSKASVSETNADIVGYLLDEGAIIIGKSNMSTNAQDARASRSKAVGETYNAYNTELASGGSSGGSAVATSLNFITASIGTDTNSSLRYPAALNGCVSLRATKGLISTDGIIKLNGARDTAGAITRTVKDQAIMLDVLTGGKTTYADNLDADALKGMRIGILKELTYPVSGQYKRSAKAIDDEVEAMFANAVIELEKCGAVVIEVSLPDIFDMSKACNENYEDYKVAKKKFYAAFSGLLTENDIEAVIFPTYLSSPLYTGVNKSGGLRIYDQIWTSNCSVLSPPIGIPEITVPIGTHSRGAGVGMEIASLKNSEQLLLNIAYSYTERYNHRLVPDTAPNIYLEYDAGTLDDFIDRYKETLAYIDKSVNEENGEHETPFGTTGNVLTETIVGETTVGEITVEETTVGETTNVPDSTEDTKESTTYISMEESVPPTAVNEVVMTSVNETLAEHSNRDDNVGKILWFIFVMLIVFIAVANFIIVFYVNDKQ